MYPYKTNLSSIWGSLFGLKTTDLTDEQFKKIDFEKLIEFLDKDPRAEEVLCEKIKTAPIKEISRIFEICSELSKYPKLVQEYNDTLKQRRSEINKDNGWGIRERIVIWQLLDNQNKEYEYTCWIKGQKSIVREDNIDLSWLYNNNKQLADDLVKKVLGGVGAYSHYVSTSANNLIQNMPKDEYIKVLPEIFSKSKYFYINALSNPETPDDYVVKALRAVNLITHVPPVKVKVSNNVLDQLPPIMRLNILEKIIQSAMAQTRYNNGKTERDNPLKDIHTPDDLKQAVFSSITKHSDRVSRLVKNFKLLINWRDTP